MTAFLTSCLMAASSCMTVSVSCCSLAISSATAFSILPRADALPGVVCALVLAAPVGDAPPVTLGCLPPPVGDSVAPVGDSLPVMADSLLALTLGDSRGPAVSGVCRDLCRKFAGTSSSDVLSSCDNHSTYTPTIHHSIHWLSQSQSVSG